MTSRWYFWLFFENYVGPSMPMGFQMMSWRLLAKSTSGPISIPETAGSPRRFQNTQSVSLGCQKTGFKLFLRCPNCWSGERVWRTLGFAHLTNAPKIHQKQITSGHGNIAKLLDWTLELLECWKSFWGAVFPNFYPLRGAYCTYSTLNSPHGGSECQIWHAQTKDSRTC